MTTILLPHGTSISQDALDLVCAQEPAPAKGQQLPPHLVELLENWNQAESEYTAVCDLFDGLPSSEESVTAIADARARMRAAWSEYDKAYDTWAAVPVEDYHEWLRMNGWVR